MWRCIQWGVPAFDSFLRGSRSPAHCERREGAERKKPPEKQPNALCANVGETICPSPISEGEKDWSW